MTNRENDPKQEDEIIIYKIDEQIDDSEMETPPIDDVASEKEEEVVENKESKHKIKGKHALKYDSIFKGKKKDESDGEYSSDYIIPRQESFDFDTASSYHEEVKDADEYARIKDLKELVYKIITEKTDINIRNSRRKPIRVDYNFYYETLVANIDTSRYSLGEIFIELSFYFSDNIFNMFKLLDKQWGGKIVKELAKKKNIKIDQIDFM